MIRSLTAIVIDSRDREAVRVTVESHRTGARAIAKRLLQAVRGEAGPDWQVLAEAMLADSSTRAGDYFDAAWRDTWKSDKPERYRLAVLALDTCVYHWRKLSGRERAAWLADLPLGDTARVTAYYAAMEENSRAQLKKWMRDKPQDARSLLIFWLFDAKAEWAHRAQLARSSSSGDRLVDLKRVAPALVMPSAHPIRKKAAEFAVQTISSYQAQYKLWRESISEWREKRTVWESEHPQYMSVRGELLKFLAVPENPVNPTPRRYRRLRPGATEKYLDYAKWLSEHISDPQIAGQIEGWHREWTLNWAKEPKPPTYSEIRRTVSGLLLQRNLGYRSLSVLANGEATAELIMPVDKSGELAHKIESLMGFEWRPVRLRADRRLAAFDAAQIGGGRVLLRRQGRVYLSFTTNDGVTPESSLGPLTPEICAKYDARWIYQRAKGELQRTPRTVIAVFPLREGANVLLRYYENPDQHSAPHKWKSLTADLRLPTVKYPLGRRAGYSGTERGAGWHRYIKNKVKSTGAIEAFGRPAGGISFAVAENEGFRHRLDDTARRIVAAVVEQAHAWGAELIVFDKLFLRSTEQDDLDRYRTMVHRRMAIELTVSASKVGMRAAGILVAARQQTCTRCGGRTIRTTYRRNEGEIYAPFGERARCLACGAASSIEHLIASNLLSALYGGYVPAKPLRNRVYDCGGINIDLKNREQLTERLTLITSVEKG